MPFRLPNGFATTLDCIKLLALVFFGLLPLSAGAELQIAAVAPYSKTSTDVIHHAIDEVTVDSGDDFRAFDLAVTNGDDHLVYLDVSTTKNFGSLTTGQDVVVTVAVDGKAVPIEKAGAVGAVADCLDANCQAETDGLYLAAKYPTSPAGQVLRIGLFPKRICAEVGALSGVCTGGAVVTPTDGDPTVIPLKVYIGLEKADGDTGNLSDTEEHDSVSLSFQSSGPQREVCPADLSEAYFPGDGEISFKPAAFSGVFSVDSGSASVNRLIVLAKDGAAPGAIDASGQITARVSSSAESVIQGFTNTTDGSDHSYQLSVGARDLAGAVSAFCTENDPSTNYSVQSSSIRGLLKESQCFIATASFRSGSSAGVRVLRRFRDEVLRQFTLGERVIELYYRWSPGLAETVIDAPVLRVPSLVLLAPLQVWAWLALNPIVALAVLLLVALFASRTTFYRPLVAIALLATGGGLPVAGAEELGTDKSLIEAIRRESSERSVKSDATESLEPYIVQQRKRLRETGSPDASDESLIESIREGDSRSEHETDDYLVRRKRELGEPSSEPSASTSLGVTLQPRKKDRVGRAFGMTVSVSQSRAVVADDAAVYRSFESLYGSGYAPDLQFFYETQPVHGEWLGSLGFFGQAGFSWKTARGTFQFELARPGGGTFPATSETEFTFVTLPVTAGAIYRLNLLRFVRPYLKAGPSLVGYAEDRSDGRGIKWGNSRGYLLGAGAAFPLGFLDSVGDWSLYEAYGIHRACLTLDYQRLGTISGALDFTVSGLSLGLLFEL